jgi:hypothetical protein
MTVTVHHNQSMLDLAVRYCGTAEAALDIAFLNGLMLTDSLTPGQKINIPTTDYGAQDVVNYFNGKAHQPATASPMLIINEENEYFPALPGMLPMMLS